MTVEYLTYNGQLTTPEAEKGPLHTYRPIIEKQISVKLYGLTGMDNEIRRVVVAEELTSSDKSTLEDWLGVPLKIETDRP